MTAVLGMVLGIIQIGFIGLLQVMCDGAAFIAAHEYSLGNASYAHVAAKPFPLMGTPVATPNPPDVASSPILVTYGGGGSAAREGGVSILMPNHSQTTVNIASSALLGSGLGALSHLTLQGSAVEPNYLVSNSAYDIAGTGYTGNAPGTTFFGSTEDTPDYYVSLHRILICTASFGIKWVTCPQFGLRTFGTAEFLDVDNWARTASPTSSAGVGPGTSYTFAEIYCHVNAYVDAASVFKLATYYSDMPSGSAGTQANGDIYDWDGNGQASYHTYVSTVEPPTHPLFPNDHCLP